MYSRFEILKVLAEDLTPVAHARIVAAIVKKNRIVAIGTCQYKSHPYQKLFGRNDKSIYLHAEIDAILKAKRRGIDLTKTDMYVIRVKHLEDNFVYGLAKPCSGCSKAILAEGIRQVYYSED